MSFRFTGVALATVLCAVSSCAGLTDTPGSDETMGFGSRHLPIKLGHNFRLLDIHAMTVPTSTHHLPSMVRPVALPLAHLLPVRPHGLPGVLGRPRYETLATKSPSPGADHGATPGSNGGNGTNGPDHQAAGTDVELDAVVDGDTSGLTFGWSAPDGGTLSSTTGQTVDWTPPDQPGSYTIVLAIASADGCHLQAAKKINVSEKLLTVFQFQEDRKGLVCDGSAPSPGGAIATPDQSAPPSTAVAPPEPSAASPSAAGSAAGPFAASPATASSATASSAASPATASSAVGPTSGGSQPASPGGLVAIAPASPTYRVAPTPSAAAIGPVAIMTPTAWPSDVIASPTPTPTPTPTPVPLPSPSLAAVEITDLPAATDGGVFPTSLATGPNVDELYVFDGAGQFTKVNVATGVPPASVQRVDHGGVYSVLVRDPASMFLGSFGAFARDDSYITAPIGSFGGNDVGYQGAWSGSGNTLALPAGVTPLSLAVGRRATIYATQASGYMIARADHGLYAFDLAARTVGPAADATPAYQDGPLAQARFNQPVDVCFDAADGNYYVADRGNHCIRRLDPAGAQVSTVAGAPDRTGDVDGGDFSRVAFGNLTAVCADDAGALYVAEDGGVIRRVTADGVATLVSGGFTDISDLAVDCYHRLWIADRGARRLMALPLP